MAHLPHDASTVTNIGPRGVRRRRTLGVVGLAAGAGISAAGILLSWAPWVRATAVLPYWLGFLGVFQARAKT